MTYLEELERAEKQAQTTFEETDDEILGAAMQGNGSDDSGDIGRRQRVNNNAAEAILMEPAGSRGSSMVIDGVDYRDPRPRPNEPLAGTPVAQPNLTYMEQKDPFGGLDLSDPEAIAQEQADDIDLAVDEETVMENKSIDLTNKLGKLDSLIGSLKSKTPGFPVGITEEGRTKYEEQRSKNQEDIKQARAEYKETLNMLASLRKEIESYNASKNVQPTPEEPIIESGSVYPERDRFRARAKTRQVETGERTLPRFYKDDLIGETYEQSFNLPTNRRTTVPLAGGDEAVFTQSEAMQRGTEGAIGIPGIEITDSAIATPYDFYGGLARRIGETGLSYATTGSAPGPADYLDDSQINRGGRMFTPTEPGSPMQVDKEKLNREMTNRENLIDANKIEIDKLNQQIDERRVGAAIDDLTARIALLEDDSEQKQAELSQLQRIKNSIE